MKTGINLDVYDYGSDALNDIFANEIEKAGVIIDYLSINSFGKSIRMMERAKAISFPNKTCK